MMGLGKFFAPSRVVFFSLPLFLLRNTLIWMGPGYLAAHLLVRSRRYDLYFVADNSLPVLEVNAAAKRSDAPRTSLHIPLLPNGLQTNIYFIFQHSFFLHSILLSRIASINPISLILLLIYFAAFCDGLFPRFCCRFNDFLCQLWSNL